MCKVLMFLCFHLPGCCSVLMHPLRSSLASYWDEQGVNNFMLSSCSPASLPKPISRSLYEGGGLMGQCLDFNWTIVSDVCEW